MNIKDTVTVYNFRVFDAHAHEMRLATCKAPLEVIASMFGGEPLEGTAHEVAVSELDDQGCYRRIATGWGELG